MHPEPTLRIPHEPHIMSIRAEKQTTTEGKLCRVAATAAVDQKEEHVVEGFIVGHDRYGCCRWCCV